MTTASGTTPILLLALVRAHQLGGLEDVPLERALHRVAVRPGLEVGPGIERVQAEEVAVPAVRRARAGVADRAEAVLALARWRLALAEAGGIRSYAPGEPVCEGADRRVRVVDDQGE